MKPIKWFTRSFDFSNPQNIFPLVIERLVGTPLRLRYKIEDLPAANLTKPGPGGGWSIQQHLGHLLDLEPLWQGRLEDLLQGEPYLRAVDLDNTKTHQAGHNQRFVNELLDEFEFVRQHTLDRLNQLTEEQVFLSALHPRLEQPMRTQDLFVFVAEHDDHHLAMISWLQRELKDVWHP